jgi:acyl-CoA synthetase (AMP-forming)/AMP-acid ligase II
MERFPDVEFANLYGSTETDMTICFRVPKGYSLEGSIPLGSPCANSNVMLLSEELSEVGSGEIGEICVQGPCLASGYYMDAEKTTASFIQNPLHTDFRDIVYRTGDLGELRGGLFFFHGRRDHQFKHLGYRIAAGESEGIAMRFPRVVSNCVIFDSKKRQIVLFYEADGEISELDFRRALMADLPVYMVPTRFVRLGSMPLNANGKKDRVRLRIEYIEGVD